MENFFDFYSVYASSNSINEKYNSNPKGKKCRFCQKSYPDVSFDKIPHIIPELFGRNNITSNFECDDCNRHFQKFESDTSTMIQHYLALLDIKSKKGVPIFKSQKEPYGDATTLSSNDGKRRLNFETNLKDFVYDKQNKTLTVDFRTRKFSPYSVYKVFLKMGISLLSEEDLSANLHFLEFLQSEEPIDNGMQPWTAIRYMLKGKMYGSPRICLFKAKETIIDNKQYPEYAMTISFANISYHFFLPISQKNMQEHKPEHELVLHVFPFIVDDDYQRLKIFDIYYLDLIETKKVSATDTITFHYQHLDEGGENNFDI
jgi:hypothetical protein